MASWNHPTCKLEKDVPLRRFSSLKVGGKAAYFLKVPDADTLHAAVCFADSTGVPKTILGGGSNVLIADDGIEGLTILNSACAIEFVSSNSFIVETGAWLQDVFLISAQAGLSGLEYAVGIPGSIGGALVSNAGAYRSQIATLVTRLEVVENGIRKWVPPEWMGFSYRNSRLRRRNEFDPPVTEVVLKVELKLKKGSAKEIFSRAKEFQRQRISKQPPMASAGSFFKNIENKSFAESLSFLPRHFQEVGIVPAGFLIEATGLKGYRLGNASFGIKHANFILNLGGATAKNIQELAFLAKTKVEHEFGIELEPEVLSIGRW